MCFLDDDLNISLCSASTCVHLEFWYDVMKICSN